MFSTRPRAPGVQGIRNPSANFNQSGQRDSNPRHSAWESRSPCTARIGNRVAAFLSRFQGSAAVPFVPSKPPKVCTKSVPKSVPIPSVHASVSLRWWARPIVPNQGGGRDSPGLMGSHRQSVQGGEPSMRQVRRDRRARMRPHRAQAPGRCRCVDEPAKPLPRVPRGQVGHGAGQASARWRGGLARSDRVTPLSGPRPGRARGYRVGGAVKTLARRVALAAHAKCVRRSVHSEGVAPAPLFAVHPCHYSSSSLVAPPPLFARGSGTSTS